jgi:hypothetical protein
MSSHVIKKALQKRVANMADQSSNATWYFGVAALLDITSLPLCPTPRFLEEIGIALDDVTDAQHALHRAILNANAVLRSARLDRPERLSPSPAELETEIPHHVHLAPAMREPSALQFDQDQCVRRRLF